MTGDEADRWEHAVADHLNGNHDASVRLSLSAEAAEGLPLDLLELARKHRGARDPDD